MTKVLAAVDYFLMGWKADLEYAAVPGSSIPKLHSAKKIKSVTIFYHFIFIQVSIDNTCIYICSYVYVYIHILSISRSRLIYSVNVSFSALILESFVLEHQLILKTRPKKKNSDLDSRVRFSGARSQTENPENFRVVSFSKVTTLFCIE